MAVTFPWLGRAGEAFWAVFLPADDNADALADAGAHGDLPHLPRGARVNLEPSHSGGIGDV